MNRDLCELKAIDFECDGFQIREDEIRERRRERERARRSSIMDRIATRYINTGTPRKIKF